MLSASNKSFSFSFLILMLKKSLIHFSFHLKGRERQRQGDLPCSGSPDATHQSQDWASLKPGAGNSIQASHVRVPNMSSHRPPASVCISKKLDGKQSCQAADQILLGFASPSSHLPIFVQNLLSRIQLVILSILVSVLKLKGKFQNCAIIKCDAWRGFCG